MEDWTKIYSTDQKYKVNLLRGLLAENDIESRDISNKDSSFLIGSIDIYVQAKDLERAGQLIEKHEEL
ncbi:MAG: DUF2007 domain-containing protein [Bacteroidota bacterium]|nr:DUF2007 domain-containing protein [Bacteroidota bacterium]